MDDTISRQSAIEAMRKCQTYRFSATEPRMIMLATAEEVIEELPSAQPTHDCDTCRYNHLEWHEEPCDSCTSGGVSSHWKPSAQPDNDMIHLQKEQAYLQGWEDGREALRKEMWEDEQDRLD